MKFLTYILYFALLIGGVALREYQLQAGLLGQDTHIAAALVLAAVLLLIGACIAMSRVKASQGKSKFPGVLMCVFSLALTAYGGYTTYISYIGNWGIMNLCANASNLALGLGMFGAALYMLRRGKKSAGFLLMLCLVWPVAWLLRFVAGRLVFVHSVDDLLNFGFLVSGALLYLQLCIGWCVPETTYRRKRTLFIGFFHAALFAMANLPACIYRFMQGDRELSLFISAAFFAVYLLSCLTVCIYIRGSKDPYALLADKPSKQTKATPAAEKTTKEEIAAFFERELPAEKKPAVQDAWLDDGEKKQDITPKEEDVLKNTIPSQEEVKEVVEAQHEPTEKEIVTDKPAEAEPEPEVQGLQQPVLPELPVIPEKKEEENDPVLDILKQVRRQKEQREQTKEEPFVYQSKKDSKKPSRFKK